MHELSLCQALIDQLESLARQHHADAIKTIWLKVGPLSGAEIPLLQHAWPIASGDSIAKTATLHIDASPIRVKCNSCGAESDASMNRLVCAECDDYHTQVISGDEVLLERVEFRNLLH